MPARIRPSCRASFVCLYVNPFHHVRFPSGAWSCISDQSRYGNQVLPVSCWDGCHSLAPLPRKQEPSVNFSFAKLSMIPIPKVNSSLKFADLIIEQTWAIEKYRQVRGFISPSLRCGMSFMGCGTPSSGSGMWKTGLEDKNRFLQGVGALGGIQRR